MSEISLEDLDHITKHISDEIVYLSNKTIIITGATGFFGKWILSTIIHLNKLRNTNISIIAISRNPDKFKNNYPQFSNTAITFIKGDLRTVDLDCSADFLVHAAMDVKQTLHQDVSDTIENEKLVIENVIKIYKKTNCKKLLFTSSGAYYDKRYKDEPRPTEYDSTSSYSTDYGKAKKNTEDKIMTSSVNYSIARCFAFLGPFLPLDGAFAAGNFIDDVIKDRDIIVNSDGKPIRSFLYMSDLIIYLLKMIVITKNIIVNVGSREEVSLHQLANKISAFNKNTNVVVKGTESSDRINCYCPNIDKLEEFFSHTDNHINLDHAIAKTINFYKKREA